MKCLCSWDTIYASRLALFLSTEIQNLKMNFSYGWSSFRCRDTNQYIAEQYIAAIYWYCQYQYQYQYWFFKNCNININIELLLAIYCQYIDRAIYCQFRAIYCRNRAIYCWLFARWENFLDDFSIFFIFRFRLTENVKSESVFV